MIICLVHLQNTMITHNAFLDLTWLLLCRD